MTWLADALRTMCIPLAAITVGISIRVIRDRTYRDLGQLFRFLGMIVLNIAVAVGGYESLGHIPRSWAALIGSTCGVALSTIGSAVIWWRQRKSKTEASLRLVP